MDLTSLFSTPKSNRGFLASRNGKCSPFLFITDFYQLIEVVASSFHKSIGFERGRITSVQFIQNNIHKGFSINVSAAECISSG
jgi:hypothetical protein